ncbi:MAG: hypothetical protein MZV64_60105 [Ignavibacteriales bacterium]|nr:hypothetical protein [Ignavibacteriales bacterium]
MAKSGFWRHLPRSLPRLCARGAGGGLLRDPRGVRDQPAERVGGDGDARPARSRSSNIEEELGPGAAA